MRRSYSAKDIGMMRYVIASSIPLTTVSQQDRILEIEEMLRTYMIAGTDPLDLAEYVNSTCFGGTRENIAFNEPTVHRVAMF